MRGKRWVRTVFRYAGYHAHGAPPWTHWSRQTRINVSEPKRGESGMTISIQVEPEVEASLVAGTGAGDDVGRVRSVAY